MKILNKNLKTSLFVLIKHYFLILLKYCKKIINIHLRKKFINYFYLKMKKLLNSKWWLQFYNKLYYNKIVIIFIMRFIINT